MTFKEAVTHVFQNYANFSGRARRSEYWYFTLFNMIVVAALSALAAASGKGLAIIFRGLTSLVSLGMFIPGLAVCWRRLHDIGKSGACFFIGLIPIVGAILLIVWYCRDSEPGDNMYGPNPKAVTRSGYAGSGSYGAGGYTQANPAGSGYSYFFCTNCGVQLRVPSGSGAIRIHCPRCGSDFNVNC